MLALAELKILIILFIKYTWNEKGKIDENLLRKA
jgi:hypothetical protein